MNLPSDLQRFLPYIAVGVLAVVGLLLVMRGWDPATVASQTPPGPIRAVRFAATPIRVATRAPGAPTVAKAPAVPANASR